MPNYRVILSLVATGKPTRPNTPVQFKKRFPKMKASKWWDLPMFATNTTTLKTEIHKRILADCRADMEADIGRTNAVSVKAFDATTWNDLGNGQHEYDSAPINVVYANGDVLPWEFTGDNNQPYPMLAGVRFYDKDAPEARRKDKEARRTRRPKKGATGTRRKKKGSAVARRKK